MMMMCVLSVRVNAISDLEIEIAIEDHNLNIIHSLMTMLSVSFVFVLSSPVVERVLFVSNNPVQSSSDNLSPLGQTKRERRRDFLRK